MAILVDDAIWPWRGRLWAHLVSDTNLDELHDFAHGLGVPYLAFQGDHYDIHADLRTRAVAAGARPVSGRELVSALRAAGLRRRGGVDPWQWQWRLAPRQVVPEQLPAQLAVEVIAVASSLRSRAIEVAAAHRPGEMLVVVSCGDAVEVDTGLVHVDTSLRLHRSSGERGTFVEWQLVGEGAQPG